MGPTVSSQEMLFQSYFLPTHLCLLSFVSNSFLSNLYYHRYKLPKAYSGAFNVEMKSSQQGEELRKSSEEANPGHPRSQSAFTRISREPLATKESRDPDQTNLKSAFYVHTSSILFFFSLAFLKSKV